MGISDKFYFMGLIFADGYLIERKKYGNEYIGISLIDEQILKDVSETFNFKKPKKCGKTSAGNAMYLLKTYDNELINEYKEYGLVPRKTLVLKLMKTIPKEYMWDFIRGYFDGDGCIHYHKVKNRINSYRGEFSLLGTKDILETISTFLELCGIKTSVKKYKDAKIYVLTLSSFDGLKKIYNGLYSNEKSLKLERKYKHFTDFLEIKQKSIELQKAYVKNEQCPRLTNEEFISKMESLYKNQFYDFKNSEYTKTKNKTTFICKIHGEVEQTISYLLRGRGCPKCSKKYADIETFIKKANIIHNNKYDYSKVEYINNKTKVCIICPEHGEFWQTPSNHLLGRGCSICGKIKNYSSRAQENRKKRKQKENETKIITNDKKEI